MPRHTGQVYVRELKELVHVFNHDEQLKLIHFHNTQNGREGALERRQHIDHHLHAC